jgi:esterase
MAYQFAMERCFFQHAGLKLSYLDSGGPLPVVVALHAHWMEAATFVSLAEAVRSEWRILALDQRGHGDSDHAQTYAREDYLGDLDALLNHLELQRVILLGHSLGGVNAYQYAARHPERVLALIIEDIGVEISHATPPILHWAGVYPTPEQLENQIGPRLGPYLRDSFRQTPQDQTPSGWKLAFDPSDMLRSQACTDGNYWQDWLSTTCPALVIRGSESRVTTADHIAEMAAKRPNTRLVTLHGGHVVHADTAAAFTQAVSSFLSEAVHANAPR